MSRQLRLEFPGAIWHITSRGNERRAIYRDDHDRRRFVRLLARVVREREWRLHAWVLMPNHYHLLIETPVVGLSRGMAWLNKMYAESFNRRHQRVGHLFQGRFKGLLVEREGHLLELIRYIVLNPVRAGMVQFAGEYAWSNYRATAGLQPSPKWLDVEWTLAQFNPANRIDAVEQYRRFVADGRGASYDPRENIVGQIYLGGDDFRRRMQTLIDAKQRSCEHPRTQRTASPPELDTIVAKIAGAFGVAADDLQRKSRGLARKALVQVAVDDAGVSRKQLAEWMQVSHSAVASLLQLSHDRCGWDAGYRARIDRIRKELS